MAFLPDGANPLPEPMLTYQHKGSVVAVKWDQFRNTKHSESADLSHA